MRLRNCFYIGLFMMFFPVILLAQTASHGGKGNKAHWSYDGQERPENWGSLSDDYHLCAKGENQSPVNIVDAAEHELDELKMTYDDGASSVVNNGHTIQVNASGGSLMVAGKKYQLLQYHFHTPSEHKIDSKSAPMEVHFVHKSEDGQLAVVGVMMREGRDSSGLDRVWRNIPRSEGKSVGVEGDGIMPSHLMPKNKEYFFYNGSLTTPPCSEGVRWFVLKDGIEVSASQIDRFKQLFAKNSRPIQPVNERHVRMMQ